jgi:hypothetical protein
MIIVDLLDFNFYKETQTFMLEKIKINKIIQFIHPNNVLLKIFVLENLKKCVHNNNLNILENGMDGHLSVQILEIMYLILKVIQAQLFLDNKLYKLKSVIMTHYK